MVGDGKSVCECVCVCRGRGVARDTLINKRDNGASLKTRSDPGPRSLSLFLP